MTPKQTDPIRRPQLLTAIAQAPDTESRLFLLARAVQEGVLTEAEMIKLRDTLADTMLMQELRHTLKAELAQEIETNMRMGINDEEIVIIAGEGDWLKIAVPLPESFKPQRKNIIIPGRN